MTLISIGGVDLPSPTEYNVSLQDIDSENTKRTETGVLQRDRVRAGVYKIEVAWKITKAQLKIITDALAPAKFSVTFFDPTTSSTSTKDMYCGDRAGKMMNAFNPAVSGENMWEFSTSLIEY